MNSQINIFVPCFNEAQRIDVKKWNRIIQNNKNVNWFFINDGSKDGTSQILKKINCTEVIDYKVNSGKAEALRRSYLKVSSERKIEIFGFIDADNAFGEGDIERMIQISHKLLTSNSPWDAVWAARVALRGRKIHRNQIRHMISRIVITLFGLFDKNFPYDSQSGFKFFKNTNQFKRIMTEKFKTRWIFEVEMLKRGKTLNKKELIIWEEPVLEWSEIDQSKINVKEIFRISIEIVKIIKILLK